MQFRQSLIVGKFCPLHKGHQLLIDTALAASDQLIIISYAKPGYAKCNRDTRANWLGALYPQVTRLVVDDTWMESYVSANPSARFTAIPHDNEPEDTHRRFTAWLCHNVLGETVEAVFTSEDYGDGFAHVLTEEFARHAGKPAPVTHVCVDKARAAIPVSGTAVRADPHANRAYLAPEVYASFVERILILGGESTGKTTLCEALAKCLNTEWAPEYGRELWETKDGALAYEDMLHIGETQTAREDALALTAHKYLVCDTSPLTTAFYSDAMFGKTDPALLALANRTYDHVFLCSADIDFVQDGTRQDTAFRDKQDAWYRDELKRRSIAFTELNGSVEQRVASVIQAVER